MGWGSPGGKAGQETMGHLCKTGLSHSISAPGVDHARTEQCGFTDSSRSVASMDMREFADSRLAAVCRDEIEEQPSPEGIRTRRCPTETKWDGAGGKRSQVKKAVYNNCVAFKGTKLPLPCRDSE